MSDLVYELRSIGSDQPNRAVQSCREAADRLEALEAELAEAREILGHYWFTSVDDGEWAEDFNNDDVIGWCERYDQEHKP